MPKATPGAHTGAHTKAAADARQRQAGRDNRAAAPSARLTGTAPGGPVIEGFAGAVPRPWDRGYDTARRVYNRAIDRHQR